MTRYILIAALFLCLSVEAQQTAGSQQVATQQAPGAAAPAPVLLTDEQIMELQQNISEYMEAVSSVATDIAVTNSQQLKQLNNTLQSIDTRWQAFYATEQQDIASSPALLEYLAQYNELYLATSDSIKSQQARLDAESNFNKAAAFIVKVFPQYDLMLKRAHEYSLIPQTAAQLANVKAREQLLMQQVTAQYQQAVAAANANPGLKSKLSTLEQKYIEIQEMSQRIQSQAYKSFMARIKDYLMSFAASAIIIMFFFMVISKLAAAKKARDMAKKYGKMMNGMPDDTPVI